MARIIKVKNTGPDATWVGQLILTNTYYNINENEMYLWRQDNQVFTDIANGVLVINNGTDAIDDFSDVVKAYEWLKGENLPISDIGGKLAVHQSSKPLGTAANEVYAVWTGSGDIVGGSPDGEIGGGEVLHFDCIPGTLKITKDVKFHPNNGRIWLHEGYLRFNGGSNGDYIDAVIVAEPTPLQTVVNKDLELVGDLIKYASGGPGSGTHGFADPTKIVLVPRTFSKDGHWDYDPTSSTPLTPNLGSPPSGNYNLHTVEKVVSKFFSKLSCAGNTSMFSMTSDETTELLQNYFLRIEVFNNSNTTWDASVIMEIYRERTFNP